MSKIIRLTVQNLLRLKAAEVAPDGSLVIVAGNNDQGKSSLLNSIAIALSGKDLPTQPIRSGASQGHVILETEELVVTRSFSQTGGSKLEVRDKDGGKVSSPQAKLDALTSKITFDPLEFTRLKPDAQLETVRRIAGIDFTELDAEYRKTYEQRTEIGRQVKAKDGALLEIKRVPDAPANEVSVADLAAELEKAQAHNRKNEEFRMALSERNDDVDRQEARREHFLDAVARAEQILAEAREALTKHDAQIALEKKERDEAKARVLELKDIPTEPIMQRMKEVDSINAAVRQNARWSQVHRELTELKQRQADMTLALEKIESTKAQKMREAAFPVEGLGFNETGVTFNGLPFEQAGSAVKIRVSLAIACSLNPALPVMYIKDGSLLDESSMAIVREYADAKGCQVWIECVGDEREDATVVIEDGTSYTPAEMKTKKAKRSK